MLHLILPKARPHLENHLDLPLFFLAGPVLGGGDWQRRMTDLLLHRVGDCIIVNPSRYQANHPQYQYQIKGSRGSFETQTLWERYYLREAALEFPTGCIIFWLPCESETAPRDDGNPYAMDTRGEVSEWRTHLQYNPKVRLVIGAEPDFPGLRTIRRNFRDAIGPNFKIYETMEETANHAALFRRK